MLGTGVLLFHQWVFGIFIFIIYFCFIYYFILIEKYFRKSVEIIPVNEIYIMDITIDIHKEINFWNIMITLFFETTLQKNSQFIICDISSVLNINEQLNIYNSTNVNLYTNNKYVKSTTFLNVPIVCS